MSLRLCASLLWAGMLAAPGELRAQQVAAPSEPKEVAAAHFSRAQQLFEQSRFLDAALEFKRAYDASPHQAVLVNIGLCFDKAGKWPEAVTYYRDYLKAPVFGAGNQDVRSRLHALEAKVGDVSARCAQAGCNIHIDGVDQGQAPVGVVVTTGSHRVEAFVNDRLVVNAVVEVGPRQRVDVVLPDIGRLALEPSLATTVPAPPPQPTTLGTGFWVSSGLTLAAATGILVFGLRTLDEKRHYQASGWTDAGAKSRGERDRLVTNVLVAVTAAATGSAVVFGVKGPLPW